MKYTAMLILIFLLMTAAVPIAQAQNTTDQVHSGLEVARHDNAELPSDMVAEDKEFLMKQRAKEQVLHKEIEQSRATDPAAAQKMKENDRHERRKKMQEERMERHEKADKDRPDIHKNRAHKIRERREESDGKREEMRHAHKDRQDQEREANK